MLAHACPSKLKPSITRVARVAAGHFIAARVVWQMEWPQTRQEKGVPNPGLQRESQEQCTVKPN